MATSATTISSYFVSGGVSSRRAPTSLSFRPATVAMARNRVVAVAELAADEGMKKKPKKKVATGIMKPRPISPELQELVGAAEMARTDVIKAVWAYIKENNLQVESFNSVWSFFFPVWRLSWDFQLGGSKFYDYLFTAIANFEAWFRASPIVKEKKSKSCFVLTLGFLGWPNSHSDLSSNTLSAHGENQDTNQNGI